MQTLYLLRHAKSSWKDASLADFDRPLKKRGREAAELMGRFLASEKAEVSRLLSSPAVRARETAKIVRKHAGLAIKPQFDERIYEADVRRLMKIISETADDVNSVMLVGHNPGMEELLAFLTGDRRRMPTCALAKIRLDGLNWQELRAGEGELEWFVTPKGLREE